LLPALLPSDIHKKAQTQTPMQMEMVAFAAMRPIYLPNNEIHLLAYPQLKLEHVFDSARTFFQGQ